MRKFFFVLFLSTVYCLLSTSLWTSSYFPKASYLHYVRYHLYASSGALDKALVELILAYQMNPKAWELCGEIVELALGLKQVGIAELYSLKAYEEKPNDPEALLWRAKTLQAQKNSLRALELLKRALDIEPENADIVLEIAGIHADLNQKSQATDYLERYLKLEPQAFDLLKVKASLELEQKDPKAMGSYQKAFKMDSQDPEVIEGLISSYETFSSKAALKKFFKETLRSDPENLLLERALCELETSGADQKACFENLLKRFSDDRDIVLDLLEFLEGKKIWDEALEALRSHSEVFKDEPLYSVKESYYLLNQGALQEAVEILEQASKTHPDNLEILYFLALGFEDLGRLEESEKVLEKIYAKRPDWKEASYNYALLLAELGHDEKMEEVLRYLWEKHPDEPNILNALGFAWSDSGKNLSQAQGLIEQALQKEPKNLFYQDSLAWALFRAGDKEKAKMMLEEVTRQLKDPEILIHLAWVRSALRQERQAWETLIEARLRMNKKNENTQPRLFREWEKAQKGLNPKQRPSIIEALARSSSASQGLSSSFRCDWKVKSQRFRTKINIKFDPREDFQVLLWPPGSFVPIHLLEAAHIWPQKEEAFKELDLALEEFFKNRSWASTQRPEPKAFRWKVRRDDVLRFEGRRVRLDFSHFYYLDEKTIIPRFIKFKMRSLECQCETLHESQ